MRSVLSMMKYLLPALILGGILCGCAAKDDEGDVAKAKAAAEAAPKTVDQLPQNMPPEARRAAAGAMGAQQAMAAQMQKANQDRMAAGK